MVQADLTPISQKFEEFFSDSYGKEFQDLKNRYPEKKSFFFSYKTLQKYDHEFAEKMVDNPDTYLKAAQLALISMAGEEKKDFEPHVRVEEVEVGEKGSLLIENIGSEHIHKMITLNGVVTKRAEIRPKVSVAIYNCSNCGNIEKVVMEKGVYLPDVCSNCKKRTLELDEKATKFVNIQRLEIQELLERVRSGSPASHIEMILDDDLCNSIIPGDTVEVVGILRLKQIGKTKEPVYAKYIDVVSIKSTQREFEEVELTKEDIKQIKEFSKIPNVFEIITNSIAPSIYGHREMKKAVALQLFGGNPDKKLPEGGVIRNDIHILLIGDPGAAKCLDGDSSIVLADGSIQKIKDVVESRLALGSTEVDDGIYSKVKTGLMSMDGCGKISCSEGAVVWKLKSPKFMYKVTTFTGKEIITTGIHPFFVPRDGSIDSVKTEELKVGDFIATPRVLKISGSKQKFPAFEKCRINANKIRVPAYVDEKFAELAGYLIGDGYLRKTGTSYEISFTTADKQMLKRFVFLIKDLFGLKCTVSLDGNGLNLASVHSTELGRLLESMGMVEESRTKSVPIEIQRSTDTVVRAFLSAYFDCKGTVRKGIGSVTLTSASKTFIEQVGILLLRFGVVSQIHSTMGRATNTEQKIARKYFRLSITGEHAKNFFEKIGFGLKRKQALKIDLKSNTNIDVVPGVSSLLKDLRSKLGIYQHQCGVARGTYLHLELGDRHPSRDTLKSVVSHMRKFNGHRETSEILDRLQALSESDLFWDKVVKIEKVKSKEKWVYDFEVPGKYNFVANGIIAHNTRLLQYVTALAPKSIYVSGKSVSGVGLTASAEKDDLGEGWTLKAGALVLASGGLAGVDEFDKIDDNERAALHEVMESGTVSVAKAGIVAKFKAKTAILAAANPKFGRFDPNQLIGIQFDIPPTLQSRFDLIFPIRDVVDETSDRKLAKYLLETHRNAAHGTVPESKEQKVDNEFLRKYVAYARKNVKPKLSIEAQDKIESFYVQLREMGKRQGAIPITPRQIEGIIRLSEASAKTRLSEVVEISDAELAIGLVEYVLKEIALDRTTGNIDVDIISTGQPRSRQAHYYDLFGAIRDLSKQFDPIPKEKILEEAITRLKFDEKSVRLMLEEMSRKGEIFEPKPGHFKIVHGFE